LHTFFFDQKSVPIQDRNYILAIQKPMIKSHHLLHEWSTDILFFRLTDWFEPQTCYDKNLQPGRVKNQKFFISRNLILPNAINWFKEFGE